MFSKKSLFLRTLNKSQQVSNYNCFWQLESLTTVNIFNYQFDVCPNFVRQQYFSFFLIFFSFIFLFSFFFFFFSHVSYCGAAAVLEATAATAGDGWWQQRRHRHWPKDRDEERDGRRKKRVGRIERWKGKLGIFKKKNATS